jgi:hypothetical protein
MWQVNVNCSAEDWKISGAEFKALADKYQGSCITSKKLPDGQRIMVYKIEDVSDAEAFTEECQKFSGFTAYFESL